MISLALFVVHASAALDVVETPMRGAERVAVVAIVRAEPRGAWEAAALRVLGEVMPEGTREYTRRELLLYGTQAGQRLRVDAMADHLAVRLAAPRRGGLESALPLVASLLQNPLLEDQTILDAARRLGRSKGVWPSVLDPVDLPYDKVTPRLVRNVALRFLRPETTTVSIAGGFAQGKGSEAVESAFRDWRPGTIPLYDPGGPIRPMLQRRERAASVELRADPLEPKSPVRAHATRLLSAFALGVGKAGALHRLVREGMGESYRQEAVMWPTVRGWSARLLVAMGSGSVPSDVGRIRDALAADVLRWQDAELGRARKLALRSLEIGLEVSPIWWSYDGPESVDEVGEASWAAVAHLAGSPSLSRAEVLRALPEVTLDELKQDASKLLEEARASFILGGPSP